MEEQQLTQVLTRLGLNEKEAQLYLAALRLGPSSISKLARESAVKRTTVYSVAERLFARGLLQEEIHDTDKLIAAAPPERLKTLLDQQRNELEFVLPYLSSLANQSQEESVIRYYQGLEQIQAVHLDFLASVKSGDDYWVLSNTEKWSRIMGDFGENFWDKRGKLPISVRMMLVDGPLARGKLNKGLRANEEVRMLPESAHLTTNLVIIPTKVLIYQLEYPFIGMVIENQHIIRMHREMCQLMWEGLKGE